MLWGVRSLATRQIYCILIKVCTPLMKFPFLFFLEGNNKFEIIHDAGGASGSELGTGESVLLLDFNFDGCM